MTTCFARLPWSLVATLGFVTAAMLVSSPVWAQGTDEQREACAPDAIKLCSDVIPDVPKTTACMRRHYSQLSHRCRVAFDAAAPAKPGAPRGGAAPRDVGGAPPAPDQAGGTAELAPERLPGLHSYAAHIREICREGLVDPFTCRNTLDLLKADE